MKQTVRIGCGAAFWGDSVDGARQLVERGDVDFLVFDYLAEITMSILARMKARDPGAGYATDFLTGVMEPLLDDIAARGIRVISNAGGINPAALGAALEALVEARGLALRIAVIEGDDLSDCVDTLRERDVREMNTGDILPPRLASINAYLGATPIAAALAAGADIVVTGRCVDSALVLGPLMHEFAWAEDDYDRLAAGSLAGHIIECGTQCTGGLFTDWTQVPDWDDMGFPIAECRADGSFEITKAAGTGGLITPASVAEQVVYEIGDPARYQLPDVVCDFSAVTLAASGADRVQVSGARGLPPATEYKACATYADGYRATAMLMIGGIDAAAKAARVGAAIIARAQRLAAALGHEDFSEVSPEILGNEATYGPHAHVANVREVVLKLAVRHAQRGALEIFCREIFPAATSMAPGLTGFAGGRPVVQPVIRLFSCLVPKSLVTPTLRLNGQQQRLSVADGVAAAAPAAAQPADVARTAAAETATPANGTQVPLIRLAHGRSGDKGDSANIGIIARRVEFLPIIGAQLTAARVADWFAHLVEGPVTRYDWPGLNAYNFVLERALGGGGVASLRHDPQGKAYAQMLLDMPLTVPSEWLAAGGILDAIETVSTTHSVTSAATPC
ncbi:MAG: acyclic terpene utilization AtuA family protein [Gammaproteobacteria bacterium]